MRPEDMLDTLYSIRDYLEDREDISYADPDMPNTAMRLKRDLQEIIVALGGE